MKILNNIFVRTLAFRGNIGSLGDFIAYTKSMFFTVHGKKVNLRIFTFLHFVNLLLHILSFIDF